jgi:riboflavin synthase
MFTGIVETMGTVLSVKQEGTNKHFEIESPIGKELHEDQSVSHNGVCLTITKVEEHTHWVTAVDETLKRSNLGLLDQGDEINLERCMKADGRFDGHIVQGHVDMKATVKSVTEQDGSWLYDFEFGNTEEVLVDKGSVTVNGVSLTCFDTHDNGFKVAIIPYTYEHTNFHALQQGSIVNLEFDILGKYVQRLLEKRGKL